MPREKSAKAGAGSFADRASEKRKGGQQSLRRDKRERNFLAKRQFGSGEEGAGTPPAPSSAVTPETLQATFAAVLAPPLHDRAAELCQLRQLLSASPPLTLQAAVDCPGLMPLLQTASLLSDRPDVQIEATWCLTNLAAGSTEQARAVLGAAPQLISLLASPDPALAEQAAWALGNIAGDSCSDFTQVLVANGLLPPMIALLARGGETTALARTAAWTLANVARGLHQLSAAASKSAPGSPAAAAPEGGPPRQQAALQRTLPFLQSGIIEALNHLGQAVAAPAAAAAVAAGAGSAEAVVVLAANQPSVDLLVDVCWLLSYLTAGELESVEQLVAQASVPQLTVAMLQLLAPTAGAAGAMLPPPDERLTPVLRVLGNTLWQSEAMSHAVLSVVTPAVLIPTVVACVERAASDYVVKEAAWVLANATACTEPVVRALVSAPPGTLVSTLARTFCGGASGGGGDGAGGFAGFGQGLSIDSKREVAFCLFHIAQKIPEALPVMLAEQPGLAAAMLQLISVPDVGCNTAGMNFVELLCRSSGPGGEGNSWLVAVEKADGIQVLEDLQYNTQAPPELCQRAGGIVDTFFGEDYMGEEAE